MPEKRTPRGLLLDTRASGHDETRPVRAGIGKSHRMRRFFPQVQGDIFKKNVRGMGFTVRTLNVDALLGGNGNVAKDNVAQSGDPAVIPVVAWNIGNLANPDRLALVPPDARTVNCLDGDI